MKNRISGFGRSSVAVVVLLCMLLSIFAPTIMAAEAAVPESQTTEEPKKDSINYVSVGDSMANGYGFVGYEQGEDSINFSEGTGVYGAGAYPLQFEDYLKTKYNTVNHTKLALSAMRAEDFLFLLGGRDEPTDDWEDQVNAYSNLSDEVLKPYFQNAITNADVITLGIGNASFGAYLMHRATDALGLFGASLSESSKVTLEQALIGLDAEQKKIVQDVYDTVWATFVNDPSVTGLFGEEKLKIVCDVFAYTVAGFLVNFKGSIEKIIELNQKEELDIILVGLMNTTYGMQIVADDMEPIEIGDMMDSLFGFLNTYMQTVAVKVIEESGRDNVNVVFAAQPEPKFICQVFETIKNKGWADVDCGYEGCYDENGLPDCKDPDNHAGRLSGYTVRDRNIDSYNDTLRKLFTSALQARGLPFELPEIALGDVEAFEANNPQWSMDYLMFMGAVFANPPQTPTTYPTDADFKNLSVAIYLGMETAIAESASVMALPRDGLLKLVIDMNSVLSGVNPPLGNPPIDIVNYLINTFAKDETLHGLCKVYGMFKVGNGMSVHPTPAGHDQVAKNVIAAYENNIVAEQDKTLVTGMEIYYYLVSHNYITAEQALDIVLTVSEEKDVYKIVDKIYTTLLKNDALDDDDRIGIITNIYAILKANYLGYFSPEIRLVEDLCVNLTNSGYLTNEKSFAIVDFVYESVIDGEVSDNDIKNIIIFIYNKLFETDHPVVISLSAAGAELTPKDKIEIIDIVFTTLNNNGYMKEGSDLLPVKALYEDLKASGDVNDAELIGVIDLAVNAVAEKGDIGAVTAEEIIYEVTEKILDSSEISDAAKVAVADKVIKAVDGAFGGEGAEVFEDLSKIMNIFNKLKAAGLMTDAQAMLIINKLRPLLMSGNEITAADITDTVKYIYNVIFARDDLSVEDKVMILCIIYGGLKEQYEEFTEQNIINAIKEYYDEAFEYAYAFAYAAGYIDIATDALDTAVAAIESAKAEVWAAELSEELRAAVLAELELAIASIEKTKSFIDGNSDMSFVEFVDMVKSYEADAYAHLAAAGAILAVAGSEALDEALELWNAYVQPEIDKVVDDIKENGWKYVIDAFKVYGPIIGEAAWEALLSTPEKIEAFMAFVETYGAYVMDFFDEYGREFVEIFGNIAVEYGIDALAYLIDNAEEGLAALGALVEKYEDKALEIIELYAKALGLTGEAILAINHVVDMLNGEIASLEAVLANLEAQIPAIEEALKGAVGDAQAELNRQLDALNAKIAEIKGLIENLKAEVETRLKEVKDIAETVKGVIDAVIELVDAVIEGSKEAIENALNNIEEAIKNLDIASKAAEKLISYLVPFAERIAAKLEAIAGELYAAAEKLVEIAEFIQNKINEINKELIELVADVKALVKELAAKAEKLAEAAVEYANNLKAFAEELEAELYAVIEMVAAVYESAVSADYIYNPGTSYYVALGDKTTTAGADTYAKVLADILGMNEGYNFSDLTGELGFTLEEALSVIGNNAEIIAGADLITVNYSRVAAYDKAIEGAFSPSTDWEAIFGAEAAAKIEALAAYIKEQIEEPLKEMLSEISINGVAVELSVDMVMGMVETYVYTQASRIVTIHLLVEELHNIAPDALVVIVGAYNEFDGVSFEIEGASVEIGEYFDILTAITNASSFACALLNENTIFVSTEGVETEAQATGGKISVKEDILGLITGLENYIVPSAEGNVDIAYRILVALNIIEEEHTHVYGYQCDPTCEECGAEREVVHSYNNACDNDCNICGYERDVEPHKYSSVCDEYCNICGEKRVAEAHSFGAWTTERESTYNVMGLEVRKCTNDGCEEKETRAIDVLVSEVNEGGASAGLVVGITIPSILVLAAGGFSGYWFIYKKKTFKELTNVFAKFFASLKK